MLDSHFVRRTCAIGALIVASFSSPTAFAQPIQSRSGAEALRDLSPPQVDLISSTTLARLEQVRALAADKNWDETIDILQQLAAEDSSRVVEYGDARLVPLRMYCHLQIARMPADALAEYRRRVDPLAERWYRDGLANRDEQLLTRVIDELFCSSWGDDALLALGELALERADYAAARRSWEQISPIFRDPAGRPLWFALRDIDVNAHWPQIERRWRERSKPPTWLAYPDSNLNLADVRARLVLASARAGDLDRAALELDVFRRLHPNVRGRFGGQDGSYVESLERLIAAAKDWPSTPRDLQWETFAGSPTRSPAAPKLGPIIGPTWAEPVQLRITPIARRDPQRARVLLGPFVWVEKEGPAATREAQRSLSCFPVVSHGQVLFSDGRQVRAADFATGRPALTGARVPNVEDSFGSREAIAHGVPRHTLTIADGVVYGRIGQTATARFDSRQTASGDRLIGLDLNREGLLVFRKDPDEKTWAFDGVPVSDGHRLFVAMRQGDITPQAYVACFDSASGNQLWRASIGAADSVAGGLGDEITHNLLTLAGDRLYFNSNLGLVAALDTNDGSICWLRRYDRRSNQPVAPGSAEPLHFSRDPSPCLYHNGLVVVAPADTPDIFALDAVTGQSVWSTNRLPDALHLLGVVRRNLIVSGNRLAALDVLSGELKFVWPESQQAGIRGVGRGLVAGDEIFWPTRNEIYVIHAMTGGLSRNSIPLGTISDAGANLAAAHGRLVVAGPDKLTVFGPAVRVPPKKNDTKNDRLATSE
jgi:outer membrane protein assembly factor BamB